jgi:hypothetical protein
MLINPTIGDSKLSNTEIEVLSRLLLVDYLYKDLPQSDKNLLLFHSKTRNQILLDIASTNPNFSKAVFNNTITSLKKKGFLSGDKRELQLNIINPIINNIKSDKDKDYFTLSFTLHGQNLV